MVKKDNKMENKVEKMEIERRESKRRRKENSAYKDFVIEVVKEKMDVWKEAKGKCKTCEEENIANECNACKEWECHICTEHDPRKRKQIRAAQKIKGVYWNCKSCDEYIKKEKNIGCIHCNSEIKDFYLNCDFCNAWKCGECLWEKENLNKEQCEEIKAATEDRAGLMLCWACGICREKKEKIENGWDDIDETMVDTNELEEYKNQEMKKRKRKKESERNKSEEIKEEKTNIALLEKNKIKKKNRLLIEELNKMKGELTKKKKLIKNLCEDLEEKEVRLSKIEETVKEKEETIITITEELDNARKQEEINKQGLIKQYAENTELTAQLKLYKEQKGKENENELNQENEALVEGTCEMI